MTNYSESESNRNEREYNYRQEGQGAEAARIDAKNGVQMRSRQHLNALHCSGAFIDAYEQTYLAIINARRGKRLPKLTIDKVRR